MRFVFCGSIGLHHVLHALRVPGRSWEPTNDQWKMDLPVLSASDARDLAAALLKSSGLHRVVTTAMPAGVRMDELRAVLQRLEMDHYIEHQRERVRFRLAIVRRGWRRRRYLR